VVAAAAQVRALATDVSAERRTRVPDFAVGVFAESELDRSAYGATFSVDLPIWNHNTGNINRAESELAAGRKRLEVQRLGVESAAVELQASCEASVMLAARYRDRIRPRAAEAIRSIERSYEVGESSLLDLLDARRTFLETRTEYLNAFARAQSARSRLAVLLGEELP
jgi:cobalt-zinc-cadmium efflux system outer membrane protein